MKNKCIFCDMVKGEEPCYKIWENEHCLAFLTIFPNTVGQAVVITKEHTNSYFADAPQMLIEHLICAAQQVARMIDKAFPDVGRTALVFEGWGVDHLHVKLYPMHYTSQQALNGHKRPSSDRDIFFEKYPGYVSTENKHTRMPDDMLQEIQKRIIKSNE